MITNYYSVTELSNLTHKTRPTIYKYILCYESGQLNDVPYNFIKLFDIILKSKGNKKEVNKFCEAVFLNDKNEKINTIVKIMKENENNLDFDKIIDYLQGELNNGKLTKSR